ncbi:DUF5827 family protein [Haloglomus litoreum]|uniref:DUF5827 family protein n=1 Tax=Haloglomus litoreum TaxID=3034026 RepID=UPI0023E8BD37|nr:DUF5827 family protein [Haloglomus sp. DT116]
MPRPRDSFDDLRDLAFREPDEVLDANRLYTVYEIARLLQGVPLDEELDVETENVLLDWAIPWLVYNQQQFVFAEPEHDSQPGYYGLKVGE